MKTILTVLVSGIVWWRLSRQYLSLVLSDEDYLDSTCIWYGLMKTNLKYLSLVWCDGGYLDSICIWLGLMKTISTVLVSGIVWWEAISTVLVSEVYGLIEAISTALVSEGYGLIEAISTKLVSGIVWWEAISTVLVSEGYGLTEAISTVSSDLSQALNIDCCLNHDIRHPRNSLIDSSNHPTHHAWKHSKID